MRELYSDDYVSVAGDDAGRLIPENLRRLAGAAVFLGLVLAMGLWAWRLGTRDATEVPVIRAMEGPARIQPDDPGGTQAAHQGLEVNTVLAAQPAPPPRVFEPATLTAESPALAAEDGPQGELILATPAPLPTADDALEADLRMPQSEDAEALAVTPAPDLTAGLDPIPLADTAEAGDPTAAAEPRPRGRPGNLVVARLDKTQAVASAPAKPAPAKAAAAPAPQPAAAPASAPAAQEVSGLGSGTRLVQLGAYDSEAITRQAWSKLVAANSDLLGSKRLYVERATSNARVFYRLRVAGFENTEQTRVMCESLKARGIDCIPVTLQ
jgi:hypothetical protein